MSTQRCGPPAPVVRGDFEHPAALLKAIADPNCSNAGRIDAIESLAYPSASPEIRKCLLDALDDVDEALQTVGAEPQGMFLLVLVAAFAGYGRTRRAYRAAIERGYRFFSFGDAMFVERSPGPDNQLFTRAEPAATGTPAAAEKRFRA